MRYLMMFILVFSSSIMAQEMRDIDTPKTELENFLSLQGTLFEKYVFKIGEVGFKDNSELRLKVVNIKNIDDGSKISGISLELFKLKDVHNRSSISAYLDFDAIADFSTAIEQLIQKYDEMKTHSIEYAELFFETNNKIKIGFYQEGLEQTAFIQLNDWQSDAIGFCGLNRFPEILKHLKAAQDKINTL